MNPSRLPKVGRWIQYYEEDLEEHQSICKVIKKEGKHQVVLEHPGGDKISEDETFFEMVYWSYIPEPNQERLDFAAQKRIYDKNRRLGYFCQACKTSDTKLLLCKACKMVHYCDRKCQSNDWPTHQAVCGKKKILLQPNPRYPMEWIKPEEAVKQRDLQFKANAMLMDALNGRFRILLEDDWACNAKATDLKTGERYYLNYDSDKDEEIYFKQYYLDTSPHANGEPTSCHIYQSMLEYMSEEDAKKLKEGGIHYLAHDYPEMFWGMALNFNTFGTVAVFSTKCYCHFPKMPPSYKRLQKYWDKIFTRAKKSGLDVQCMFADTPTGCHSFGLEGEAGCKFKHDISVEITK